MCVSGMLLRYYVHFYDMEIIEEEAFLAWKEDITQEFPGKGKALFQVFFVEKSVTVDQLVAYTLKHVYPVLYSCNHNRVALSMWKAFGN